MPKQLQYSKWSTSIQAVVASLGGSTTQAELNTVAFSAFQTALSAPTSDE